MCFVWIWEQTAIISLYNINWLVFITETECVYCAVRTGYPYRHIHTIKFLPFHESIRTCTSPRHVAAIHIAVHILYLGTRWILIVNFTLRLIYPWGSKCRYLVNRRLGAPQSRTACFRKEEKYFAPVRNQSTVPRSSIPYPDHCSC